MFAYYRGHGHCDGLGQLTSDDPAGLRGLDSPTAVVAAPDGGLYVADTGNDGIVHISRNGHIHTLAGSPDHAMGVGSDRDG